MVEQIHYGLVALFGLACLGHALSCPPQTTGILPGLNDVFRAVSYLVGILHGVVTTVLVERIQHPTVLGVVGVHAGVLLGLILALIGALVAMDWYSNRK